MLIDEEIQVEIWNRNQLLTLGFSEFDAVSMTEQRISWHDVAKLLNSGCPKELAIEILR